MQQPIIQGSFLLKRFPGKGGWTFVEIEKKQARGEIPFNWHKVTGHIDDYELKNAKLAPYGGGKLFLPVRAEIRKAIGKEAGDVVELVLFADIPHETLSIESEEAAVLECFRMSGVYDKFLLVSEEERQRCLEWINSAKRDEIKVQRINLVIDRLVMGLALRPV